MQRDVDYEKAAFDELTQKAKQRPYIRQYWVVGADDETCVRAGPFNESGEAFRNLESSYYTVVETRHPIYGQWEE